MVVKPNRVDLLQSSDHNMLTLMTCVPVGTAWNRLIIQAGLVSII
jgi:sortase (surface protein transpeptidase)